jgi:hypothetical protein
MKDHSILGYLMNVKQQKETKLKKKEKNRVKPNVNFFHSKMNLPHQVVSES